MSIKPHYANLIFAGIKKFEFRKKLPKEKIDKVYVYSSSPIKKIIGYFEVDYIIHGTQNEIWEKTYCNAGIDFNDYKSYFDNSVIAYAMHINKTILYDIPIDPYCVYKRFRPPQSFFYLKEIDRL